MKNKLYRVVIPGLSLIGGIFLCAATASAALPSTGKCGMLSGMPHTLETAAPSPTGTYDVDVMAVIDFGAKTITARMSEVDFPNSSSGANYSMRNISSTPFTVSRGLLPGETNVSFTPPGSSLVVLHMLPVNGGNTILIQADNDPFHGVCEMM